MLLSLLLSFAPAFAGQPDDEAITAAPPPPDTAAVTSVYDGDTFTLSTGDKVRLRWVNTPEIRPLEPYAIEARDAASALVGGKLVTLLYGETKRDGYGRLLAGAEIDGRNLSIHLLELGLAHIFIIPPDDTDLTAFIEAQNRARAARRGIWSTPGFQGVLHITSFHANADGDDRQNVNGEYLRVCNVSAEPQDLSGFRIADISGNSWEMPRAIVPAGHTVEIHSGVGQHQVDPTAQIEIFLGSRDPIWNNKADRATIYDRYGRVVDTRIHEVQKETP